jgi:hypothetical protein
MSGSRIETASFTSLHWIAIGLTAITGVVHVGIGFVFTDYLLGLAGLGFFGAIALVLLDVRRRLLYLLGIPYTAIQFVLYFVFNWPNVLSPVGIGDKVVQVALVVALYLLYQRETEG